MNTQHTLEQMQELKLKGMAECYETQLTMPVDQQLESHEMIAHLLAAEKLQRGNDRMEYLLKNARLRFDATPETIICKPERNLTKTTWSMLLEGRYLQDGSAVLITGPTGTGYAKQMIM